MPRHSRLLLSLLLLIAAYAGSAATVQAETVTFTNRDDFNAATTGNSTIDFNGIVPPGGVLQVTPSFTSDGVTFTALSPYGQFIIDTGRNALYQFANASGGVLSVQGGTTAEMLNISLGSGFTAIGFDINTFFTNSLSIIATLSNGDTTTFNAIPGGGFIGFTTTTPISSLTLANVPTGTANYFNIDNFTFGTAEVEPNPNPVPEPTTMLLLGTGLVGIAAKVRNRYQASKSEEGQ